MDIFEENINIYLKENIKNLQSGVLNAPLGLEKDKNKLLLDIYFT